MPEPPETVSTTDKGLPVTTGPVGQAPIIWSGAATVIEQLKVTDAVRDRGSDNVTEKLYEPATGGVP